jgi:integrase
VQLFILRTVRSVRFFFKGCYIIKKPKTIKNKQARALQGRVSDADRILIRLAVRSGLRISDLLSLRVEDLGNTMIVHETKSKRKREFKIGKKLHKELRSLTAGRASSDFLFPSVTKSGKHLHRSTVHRRIKRAIKTLDWDCSAHSMRKLYAQNIYRDTGSVKKVQKAMNHHKITTTATYLDIDLDKYLRKGAK